MSQQANQEKQTVSLTTSSSLGERKPPGIYPLALLEATIRVSEQKSFNPSAVLSSLVWMGGVIYVYIDTVFEFYG